MPNRNLTAGYFKISGRWGICNFRGNSPGNMPRRDTVTTQSIDELSTALSVTSPVNPLTH